MKRRKKTLKVTEEKAMKFAEAVNKSAREIGESKKDKETQKIKYDAEIV